VNLWSPVPNLNYRHKGFGYLLPQTISAERNPHAALGVMFDSDRTTVADHALPTNPLFHRIPTGDTVPGTKVTVMLGGHHWSDLPPAFLPDAATSDAAGIQAAKETLRIQMGIDPATWQAAGTKLCVDCIPQHLVGHAKKMEAADWELRQAYGGKLAVVGGSYTAPGVMGAARGARDVAQQVAGGFRTEDGNGEVADSVGDTGLARFVGGTARLWKPAPKGLLEEIRRNRAVIDKTTKAYQEGWAMWDF
jgi:oxygen-dependent protoporphyrinogen oxidase